MNSAPDGGSGRSSARVCFRWHDLPMNSAPDISSGRSSARVCFRWHDLPMGSAPDIDRCLVHAGPQIGGRHSRVRGRRSSCRPLDRVGSVTGGQTLLTRYRLCRGRSGSVRQRLQVPQRPGRLSAQVLRRSGTRRDGLHKRYGLHERCWCCRGFVRPGTSPWIKPSIRRLGRLRRPEHSLQVQRWRVVAGCFRRSRRWRFDVRLRNGCRRIRVEGVRRVDSLIAQPQCQFWHCACPEIPLEAALRLPGAGRERRRAGRWLTRQSAKRHQSPRPDLPARQLGRAGFQFRWRSRVERKEKLGRGHGSEGPPRRTGTAQLPRRTQAPSGLALGSRPDPPSSRKSLARWRQSPAQLSGTFRLRSKTAEKPSGAAGSAAALIDRAGGVPGGASGNSAAGAATGGGGRTFMVGRGSRPGR